MVDPAKNISRSGHSATVISARQPARPTGVHVPVGYLIINVAFKSGEKHSFLQSYGASRSLRRVADRMPLAGIEERLLLGFNHGHFLEGGVGVMISGVEWFLTFERGYILVSADGT